jgi:hypothetical protein
VARERGVKVIAITEHHLIDSAAEHYTKVVPLVVKFE